MANDLTITRRGPVWDVTHSDGRKVTMGGSDAARALELAREYFDTAPSPAFARAAALAEQRGEDVCARCGGAGGASQWPGWTCFDCSGRGTVAK